MSRVYLNCPVCHLAVLSKTADAMDCPRCARRDDERVPMFTSPLPYRLLAGPLFERWPSVQRR